MSTESIYNLITPTPAEHIKQPLHKSKYNPTVPPTASTFLGTSTIPLNVSGAAQYHNPAHTNPTTVQNPNIKQFSHFGPKTQHISQPTDYLKKTAAFDLTAATSTTNPSQFAYTDKRKPLLDNTNTTYIPAGTVATDKNYIHENMLAAIMSDCKKPSSATIDYLTKADYGAVPAYLQDIKQAIAGEKQYIRSILQQQAGTEANKSTMRLLPDADRLSMLATLKQNWEVVHGQYQSMTHLTVLDARKMKQKEELEQRLSSLESSIDKLSKQQVYVQEE